MFGKNIIYLRKVGSTNDLAKELADYGAVEGTVIVAETQTAGHGRLGAKWFSPVGGLWFSIILRPKLKVNESAKLVFVPGLAVTEVLNEFYELKVETKWPNDVMIRGRKICGVLSKMNTTGGKVNYSVMGIGVNGNFQVSQAMPRSLRKTATSLEDEFGREVCLEELFRLLLERLERVYYSFVEGQFEYVLERWKSYASFLGKVVEVSCNKERFEGLAKDIDQDGALILQIGDAKSTKRVFAGAVSLRVKR
jgi:BirA family biotin operon repressor/biotin-[acetyl-CoA-carboxylase] ligase